MAMVFSTMSLLCVQSYKHIFPLLLVHCYLSKHYVVIIIINHNYLSRNLKFVLNISTASRSLLQQTEVTLLLFCNVNIQTVKSMKSGHFYCEVMLYNIPIYSQIIFTNYVSLKHICAIKMLE